MADHQQLTARRYIDQAIAKGIDAQAALAVPAVREEILNQIAKLVDAILELDLSAADAHQRLMAAALPAQAAHRVYRGLVKHIVTKGRAEDELRRLEDEAARRREP